MRFRSNKTKRSDAHRALVRSSSRPPCRMWCRSQSSTFRTCTPNTIDTFVREMA